MNCEHWNLLLKLLSDVLSSLANQLGSIKSASLVSRSACVRRIDASCFNCFIDPALFKAINARGCFAIYASSGKISGASAAVIASVSLPTRRISQRGAGAGGASAHHRRAEPQGHAMSHTSSAQRIREVQGPTETQYCRYVTGESNTTAPPKKYKTRLFKSSALFHIENALFYFCARFHPPKCVALVVDIVQMAFQGHRLSHLGLHLKASELHRAAGVPSF